MNRIAQIEKAYLRDDLPDFKSGDTLKVHVKIKEGDKERVQVFQGTVISRRGGGTAATFTVRKITGGIGVERIFPLHSPNIDKIEKLRSGAVRRSKLYYLRELTGKSARIKEQLDDVSKTSAAKAAKAKELAEKEAAESKAKAEAETSTGAEAKTEK
jgi:large subunit ribosomal protein L19